ncbi:hypothetical protein EBME_1836 [bacterium endosymbiont of Mortierella elongata FMR23-6]|nr:hypothetical protein EBME_1836 [bacterium endosymbiont of Mortierella elongata FMR23-6]
MTTSKFNGLVDFSRFDICQPLAAKTPHTVATKKSKAALGGVWVYQVV